MPGKNATRSFAVDRRDRLIDEIEEETRATAPWTGRAALGWRVLAAMRKVPRERFVPEAAQEAAYRNAPLAIGHRQTISQPFIVAIMTELLDLEPDHVVLEVGTGSGYQAAVLAELVREVDTIEVIPALAERAQAALVAAGYANIRFRCGDGALGWPERAPFDAIMVTAAAAEIPPALIEQLRQGGRMMIPVGYPHGTQDLVLIEKRAGGEVSRRVVLQVAFVPLTRPGKHDTGET
jgi:protein-L-isoaspartate(D-aspartate) O-methyltransferase